MNSTKRPETGQVGKHFILLEHSIEGAISYCLIMFFRLVFSSDVLFEFLHSDDRDYDSIRMDPVVDFDISSSLTDEDKSRDGDGVKAPDSNTSNLYKKEEPTTDFDLHILIPNLDIEVHAAQTPSPAKQSNVDIDQIDTNKHGQYIESNIEKLYREKVNRLYFYFRKTCFQK